MDSLIICKFLRGVFEDFYAEAADMLHRVTGWDATADELRETARRIVGVKRQFNLLAGWTAGRGHAARRGFSTRRLPSDPTAALSREQLEALVDRVSPPARLVGRYRRSSIVCQAGHRQRLQIVFPAY